MEIITGYTGTPHVTSEQDRDINKGIVGEESYVLRTGMMMKAEVSNNNEVKVRDGVIIHQGCAASIKKNTYDSLRVINGSQGMKRIDLIVARYERNIEENDTESMNLVVIQGIPSEQNPETPEYKTGDIQAGDNIADMPLYEVILDGLNIIEVKKVFKEARSIEEIEKELDSLNGKIPKESENYVKFPDGTLMQWGTVESPSGGNSYGTISFPVPFANMDYKVLVEAIYPNPNYITFTTSVSNVNASQVTVYFRSLGDGSITGVTANWLAIGKWK